MSSKTTPIIIGAGQLTNRAQSADEILSPMDLMERSANAASEDARAAVLPHLDSVTVINLISHPYADPARQLAARLGAAPNEAMTTAMGGNSPQWRVNETADRIATGEISMALIAGAEAFHSLKIARRDGVDLDWGQKGDPGMVVGDDRDGSNDVERTHNAQLPIRIYPLFENALRAEIGLGIAQHAALIGNLCAGMSEVAAANPHAWFRTAKTAAQLTADSSDNRVICSPYRKYMNAIMAVDQGAAIILTNTERARELGVPESQWVYVRGCGDANDHWHVSDRIDFHSSPAIRLAGERALQQAGTTIDEVEFVDFYSCFPSALQIGARMLGVAADGSRALTVTGGLPYHGGPGSNYSTHAIAQVVERVRAATDTSFGLVTGVGWYMTKHSVGLYSNEPPSRPWVRHDVERDQAALEAQESPPLIVQANGRGTIETYTVVHERDGTPSLGIAAMLMDSGGRAWANLRDPEILQAMETEEFVGAAGSVTHKDAQTANVLHL